ncbi:MAG: molybdopterin-synthase adenylyltransferase MoeB [Acidobacteria bacterium]|nr:MAG: molybdopterin-synthase adenylyltransferase MoeB [Acidobacteriota bacterium]
MAKTYREYLNDIKKSILEVTPAEADQLRKEGWELIDVRSDAEFEQGAIPGARHIDRGFLESRIESEIPDRASKIVLYCAGGFRSAMAASALQELGYTTVASMARGFNGWKDDGLEWHAPQVLNAEQRNRYHRHILLPEVGVEGQTKLLESSTLLLGAGGLGSPAALYLAAAGVGRIGIVDYDVVDSSNLQRQIIHSEDRVGMLKVDSAKEAIAEINPEVKVETYNTRLQADNVLEIMGNYGVVVDGCDNFPTRYLVNDASIMLGKPVVHGSIFRFDGQVSVFWPGEGPCYRCLYHQPPPPELAPSCAEAGVLGVLPGIIGSLQTAEALKLILGIGETLVGRLLTFDALDMSFRTLKLRRDPDCPSCGGGASVELIDYDEYCLPGRPSAH